MPWTEITRPQYRRTGLKYASDLTDAEWSLIEPFMPKYRRLGRPRSTELRRVVDGVFYIATTGCQWRQLPRDFPPYSTVQSYFNRWIEDGRWQVINHALVIVARERAGLQPSPTAGVIDSRRLYPWLRHIFADDGYAGDKLHDALVSHGAMDGADHQTVRHRARLRGATETVGCGTDLCMARAVSQARQRL